MLHYGAALFKTPTRALVVVLVCFWIKKKFQAKFGETWKDMVGRLMLRLPAIRREYCREINGQLRDFRALQMKKMKAFGEMQLSIPDEGIPIERLKRVVDSIAQETQERCENNHMSGSIYCYSYWKKGKAKALSDRLEDGSQKSNSNSSIADLSHPNDFRNLNANLEEIFTYSFRQSYLWNSLHGSEFGVGDWLNYQVVNMVSNMFGGNPEHTMGFVTSGGTDSLMTAMRCYREWGMNNHNHIIGEGVILCLDSVHAAVDKAAEAYHLKLVSLDVDEDDVVDLNAVRRAVKKIGSKLICIVGSAPSYPLGTVDQIQDLAAIARDAGVGFHVDCCLGGFVINFLDTIDTNFLAIPGVTSLSCDTHKNGWAPKGSSVLVTQPIQDRVLGAVNLAYYSCYVIPGWSGGLYGTPSNPGSQHCTHALHAFLAMQTIGKSGYRKIATKINDTVKAMAEIIGEQPQLKVIGGANVNVVAWRVNPTSGWSPGAIYAFAYEMDKRNITLSVCSDQRVHFCVTGRSAVDPNFLRTFRVALLDSITATDETNTQVLQGKASFPGDAGLYGTIEAAMAPTMSNSKSFADYVINSFLGGLGAKDGVRAYFYAIFNPFSETLLGDVQK